MNLSWGEGIRLTGEAILGEEIILEDIYRNIKLSGVILIKTNDFLNNNILYYYNKSLKYNIIGIYFKNINIYEVKLYNIYDNNEFKLFDTNNLEKILSLDYVERICFIPVKFGMENMFKRNSNEIFKENIPEDKESIYTKIILNQKIKVNGMLLINRIIDYNCSIDNFIKKYSDYEDEIIISKEAKLLNNEIIQKEYQSFINISITNGLENNFYYIEDHLNLINFVIKSISNNYIDIDIYKKLLNKLNIDYQLPKNKIIRIDSKNIIDYSPDKIEILFKLKKLIENIIIENKFNLDEFIYNFNLLSDIKIKLEYNFFEKCLIYYLGSKSENIYYKSNKNDIIIDLNNINFNELNRNQLIDLLKYLENFKNNENKLNFDVNQLQNQIINHLSK